VAGPGSAGVVVGEVAAVAVDALGRPHIAYYDAANQTLKYARYVQVGLGRTVASHGRSSSLQPICE
jgi:hypothetical protein